MEGIMNNNRRNWKPVIVLSQECILVQSEYRVGDQKHYDSADRVFQFNPLVNGDKAVAERNASDYARELNAS